MKVAILGDGHDSIFLKNEIIKKGGFCQIIESPLRVYKKFCSLNEAVKPSRFIDLFRVVYFKNDLEYFEDFDVVIDNLDPLIKGMGPDGIDIVGESTAREDKRFFYHQLPELLKSQVLIIGQDSLVKVFFEKYSELILKERKRIVWLPGLGAINFDLEINSFESDFKEQKIKFYESIESWKKLEDYEKVKIPKPKEPEKTVEIHKYYQATAIDFLSDREQVFMTIESPSWRKSGDFYRVMAFDQVIILNGVKPRDDKYQFLKYPDNTQFNDLEKGFLTLYPKAWNSSLALKGSCEQILELLHSYFSPKSS